MRQRTIKDLGLKIEEHSTYMIKEPKDVKGKWHEVFGNNNPIELEIGSGKGKFITEKAIKNPNINYIAFEGQDNVIIRLLEKADELKLPNLRIAMKYVNDMHDFFEVGEIRGIYLNFSDPWPKARHAKRRLTYHKRLLNYKEVMPRGFVEFKTDNDVLFEFSLEEIELAGLKPQQMTRDLHASEYISKETTTEYEDRFSAKGKNINYVRLEFKEDKMIFVAEQGRTIPKEDRLFGISNRAKAMIQEKGKDAVVDATIGVLLDDDGELVVLSSVDKVFKSLKPSEYAAYAPISGIPQYREAVKKAAFGSYVPKGYTEAVATPGGTGGIHNAIINFTEAGQTVLIADWFWATYNQIATEIGRTTTKFELFTEEGKFNLVDFEKKFDAILEKQDRILVILNTPAHNPTGYAMTDDDWRKVCDVFKRADSNKKIVVYVDAAYIDFAGDEEDFRSFLPIIDDTPENVLPIFGYSLSKTFTLYGLRGGAMICMAKSQEVATEFQKACEFSSRSAWSNSPRAAQVILAKIYSDPELKAKVDEERKAIRDMLLRRGKAFDDAAKACGLKTVPFTSGFFCSVPCNDPDAVSKELEQQGIFLVPLAKGVRVSIASISEKVAAELPKKILEAKNKVDK